jgi:hypothetical protein
MRKTCKGCPALETKDKKPYCFYYESWVVSDPGCGNDFKEKPKKTQSTLEYEHRNLKQVKRNKVKKF